MWGHSLRDRVAGVLFDTRAEAIDWIENYSRQWVEREIGRGSLGPKSSEPIVLPVELPELFKIKAVACQHKALRATDPAIGHFYQELAVLWGQLGLFRPVS